MLNIKRIDDSLYNLQFTRDSLNETAENAELTAQRAAETICG